MAEFDRTAVALETVKGLSDNEINRIAGLRVSGEKFETFMGEIRDALHNVYGNGTDQKPDASDVVDGEVLVARDESELADQFLIVDAVWQLELSDFTYYPNGRMADFVAEAVREVYVTGVAALINHVEALVDEAEMEHEDDEDGEDEDGE